MNCCAMAVSILLLRRVCLLLTTFLCILCDVWYDVLHPLDVDFDLFYAGDGSSNLCLLSCRRGLWYGTVSGCDGHAVAGTLAS